jgi:hypothetical protein
MKRLIARAVPLAACLALAVPGMAAARGSKNEFSGIPSPTGQPVPQGFTDLQNLCTLTAAHNSCEAVAPTVTGEPTGGPAGQLVAIARPDLLDVYNKHPNSCDDEGAYLCAAQSAGYSVANTPTVGAMMLIPTGSTIQYADGTIVPASTDSLGLVVTQLLANGEFVAAGALGNGEDALIKIAAVTVPANASLEFVPYAPAGDKLDAFGDLYSPDTGLGFLDGIVTKLIVTL